MATTDHRTTDHRRPTTDDRPPTKIVIFITGAAGPGTLDAPRRP
jgi:hypothetical protein